MQEATLKATIKKIDTLDAQFMELIQICNVPDSLLKKGSTFICPKCSGLCTSRKIKENIVYDCHRCKDQISPGTIINVNTMR